MKLNKYLRQINTDTHDDIVRLNFYTNGNIPLIKDLMNYDSIVDMIDVNQEILTEICEKGNEYDLIKDNTRYIMIMVGLSTLNDLNIRIQAMLQSLIIYNEEINEKDIEYIPNAKNYVKRNENEEPFKKFPRIEDRQNTVNRDDRNSLVHNGIIPILKGNFTFDDNEKDGDLSMTLKQFTNPHQIRIEQVKQFLDKVDSDIEKLNEVQNLLVEVVLNSFKDIDSYIDNKTMSKFSFVDKNVEQ